MIDQHIYLNNNLPSNVQSSKHYTPLPYIFKAKEDEFIAGKRESHQQQNQSDTEQEASQKRQQTLSYKANAMLNKDSRAPISIIEL
jgi:hypothetical protein